MAPYRGLILWGQGQLTPDGILWQNKNVFSELGPWVELGIFVGLLLGCYLLLGVTHFRNAVGQLVDRLVQCVQQRGVFCVADVSKEKWRIDFLRVLLGGLVTFRTAENFFSVWRNGDMEATLAAGAATALAICVCVGLATPIACGALAVTFNTLLDNLVGTSTLGTQTATIALLFLANAPSGQSFSLDKVILTRQGLLTYVINKIYIAWGPLTPERIVLARLVALVCYASLHFSSGLHHLQCESWRMGLTGAWVLLNPMGNVRFHDWADWMYQEWPSGYLIGCKTMIYGTLVLQLGCVPMVLLCRWTRRLAILLELGFLIGSVTVLNLPYFGWYQFLLVLLLFGDSGWGRCWRKTRAQPTGSMQENCSRRNRLVLAGIVCFAVLWLGFVVRLPFLCAMPGVAQLANISKTWLGATPLAVGMRQVDVFNFAPYKIRLMKYCRINYCGAKPVEKFLLEIPSTRSPRAISDVCYYQSISGFVTLWQLEALPTELSVALLERPGLQGLLRGYRRRGGLFYMDWSCHCMPNVDDFQARRYVSRDSIPVCRICIDAVTLKPLWIQYDEAGVEAMKTDWAVRGK